MKNLIALGMTGVATTAIRFSFIPQRNEKSDIQFS